MVPYFVLYVVPYVVPDMVPNMVPYMVPHMTHILVLFPCGMGRVRAGPGGQVDVVAGGGGHEAYQIEWVARAGSWCGHIKISAS